MTMHAVTVNDLAKIYKLYDRPSDRLKELLFRRPFHKEFFALDGVSFTMRQGETFGVIGDNGAGKSTLLKILARTLSPTRGQFEVKGVVSSMLELGSGFHPEFTGIENIFFYGSLLGIDNNTMKSKVDEIVDFSELGDFVHYPIKTYSSGMHLRLAFSVATVVDPDVLIIDEALSVGDQYFQKKCLDKMDQFKKRKKTVIFCSHDLYQVKSFCEKTLWLQTGQVKMLDESSAVVNAYAGYEQTKTESYKTELAKSLNGSSFLFIKDLSVNHNGPDLAIEFIVKSLEPFEGHLGWAILRRDMLQISFMSTAMQGKEPILFTGSKKVTINIDSLNLVNDNYFIYVGVFDKQAYKPIAVDAVDCTLNTGYEILNSLCQFNSTFIVE
jgi:ABC-type polysaccharide/polyol phosphate transport system ATPase subunit